jgi:acetyltransferase-like isoleucine patch superfamily enzyme
MSGVRLYLVVLAGQEASSATTETSEPTRRILVRIGANLRRTRCNKSGALVGDHWRIGANAVLAPGALVNPGSVVRRGALRDEETLST